VQRTCLPTEPKAPHRHCNKCKVVWSGTGPTHSNSPSLAFCTFVPTAKWPHASPLTKRRYQTSTLRQLNLKKTRRAPAGRIHERMNVFTAHWGDTRRLTGNVRNSFAQFRRPLNGRLTSARSSVAKLTLVTKHFVQEASVGCT